MSKKSFKYLYGPVNSKRLGLSLGVDIIPYKICSFDCIYCQLGRTTEKTIVRREFTPVGDVLEELKVRLDAAPQPDYISFSGSGEPTLNLDLGQLINEVKKQTKIPIVVLTNGSLLWREDLRKELLGADLVLPSLDAGDEVLFEHVNRPHSECKFKQVLDGLIAFTEEFSGEVWLEVFLLAGITSIEADLKKLADCVKQINPARTQLNTVSRPPVQEFSRAVPAWQLQQFKDYFPGTVDIIAERSDGQDEVESSTRGSVNEEILALLSRRPCRVRDISRGLGLPAQEVIKYLAELDKEGVIAHTWQEYDVFYKTVRPE